MNYLVGVILSIYISWFIFSFEKPELPSEDVLKGPEYEPFMKFFNSQYVGKADNTVNARQKLITDYDNMYQWLYFHLVYLFISLVLSMCVFFVYYTMNSKLIVKDPKKNSKVDESK
jgi:hypothetical protein